MTDLRGAKTREDMLERYNAELEKEVTDLQKRLRDKELLLNILRQENIELVSSKIYNSKNLDYIDFFNYLKNFYGIEEIKLVRTGPQLRFRKFASYFLTRYFKLPSYKVAEMLMIESSVVRTHSLCVKHLKGMSFSMEVELHLHRKELGI